MNIKDKIEWLLENADDVHTQEDMLDFAKNRIDEGYIFVAIHILQAIHEDTADYYKYDFGMGTLETPTAITEEDEKYINDLISEYE